MPVSRDTLSYRPCAGIMVLNRAGLVFVGRRVAQPNDAEGQECWWQMPQGGIDDGEDPRSAALRELREETSIRSVTMLGELDDWVYYDLPEHLLGRVWKGRYRGQKQKWFAVRFTGHDREIDIHAPAGGHRPEFSAWRWIPMDMLVDQTVPFKQDAYRRVVRAFSPLVGA